jgi:hypothetical protein
MFALSKFEWLVLALALLLCPGWSWGAEPEASLFERLDRNKDGYLSPEELASDEAKQRNWIAVDGLVTSQLPKPQPNAAAGGSAPPPAPKQE